MAVLQPPTNCAQKNRTDVPIQKQLSATQGLRRSPDTCLGQHVYMGIQGPWDWLTLGSPIRANFQNKPRNLLSRKVSPVSVRKRLSSS